MHKIKFFNENEATLRIAKKMGYLSNSLLRKRLAIGYQRAKRLIEKFKRDNVIDSVGKLIKTNEK